MYKGRVGNALVKCKFDKDLIKQTEWTSSYLGFFWLLRAVTLNMNYSTALNFDLCQDSYAILLLIKFDQLWMKIKLTISPILSLWPILLIFKRT